MKWALHTSLSDQAFIMWDFEWGGVNTVRTSIFCKATRLWDSSKRDIYTFTNHLSLLLSISQSLHLIYKSFIGSNDLLIRPNESFICSNESFMCLNDLLIPPNESFICSNDLLTRPSEVFFLFGHSTPPLWCKGESKFFFSDCLL